MADYLECLHCGNRVAEIKFVEGSTVGGGAVNKYKHIPPFETVVCGTSPMTDDDVQWTSDEE